MRHIVMSICNGEKVSDSRQFDEAGSVESGLAGSQPIRDELNRDRWESKQLEHEGRTAK